MATLASIIDGVVTRAISTNEPSTAILEAAQRQVYAQDIRF
jgi:hypothetical protein